MTKPELIKIADLVKIKYYREIGDIEKLCTSIKENGLMIPINVIKCGRKYKIIDGQRRVEAYKTLNLDTIMAFVLIKD